MGLFHSFLDKHATATIRTPLQLSIWSASNWTDAKVVECAKVEAISQFGEPNDGDSRWSLSADFLQRAIDFAILDEQRPKQKLGPVRLFFSYSLKWKALPNPVLNSIDEPFGRGNWVGISIDGGKIFIQPTFLFEPNGIDKPFLSALHELENDMPFKPNEKYYHFVLPKKNGGGFKLVKPNVGWKDANHVKNTSETS